MKRSLMPPRRVLGVVAVVLVLAGCGSKVGDEVESAGPPATTAAPTTTTLVPPNPDAAYFNGVLKALNHIRGDVRREVWGTNTFSARSQQLIKDAYADNYYPSVAKYWSGISIADNSAKRRTPGDDIETVVSVTQSTSTCALLETMVDNSQVVSDYDGPTGPWLVGLRLYSGSNGNNGTRWKIDLQEKKATSESTRAC